MCDIKDGFKLCSCDEENLQADEIDWKLKRIDRERRVSSRRGKAMMPRYNKDEALVIKKVLKNLNSRNCFDFDYAAQEDDRLELKLFLNPDSPEKFRTYPFRFVSNEWTQDKSTSLSSWRSRLVSLDKGKIN